MSDDEEGCKFEFSPTDEEIKAFRWLFGALDRITESDQSAKLAIVYAALVRRSIYKWGHLHLDMHRRIHELEDAVHALGGVIIEPEPRRIPPEQAN